MQLCLYSKCNTWRTSVIAITYINPTIPNKSYVILKDTYKLLAV